MSISALRAFAPLLAIGGLGGLFGHAPPAIAGPEFPVNTFTAGFQQAPRVAVLANGSFVVVWQSLNQDGSSNGVYGQRFRSNGVRISGEFPINTFTVGGQFSPVVAPLADGGFVVVWVSSPDQDGSAAGVFGQRFRANGLKAGNEFRINTIVLRNQNNPSVAALPGGGFVAAWIDESQQGVFKLHAQRFAASGGKVGQYTRVVNSGVSTASPAKIAVLANGSVVILWTSSDGAGLGVFARRYDPNGNPGNPFRVNNTTVGDQIAHGIAALDNGGFVVVWRSGGLPRGQRYRASGTKLGGEFSITNDGQFLDVAALDTGGFIVVYSPLGKDGSDLAVYGQRFSSTGARVGSGFQINQTTQGYQAPSAVAGHPNGGFVVVFESATGDGSNTAILGRRFAQ